MFKEYIRIMMVLSFTAFCMACMFVPEMAMAAADAVTVPVVSWTTWVTSNWAQLIEVAFALVGVASLIAKLTPTKADDKIINTVLGFLNWVAINPKKHKARD
jgi:hypothetical protein